MLARGETSKRGVKTMSTTGKRPMNGNRGFLGSAKKSGKKS